MLVYKNLKQSFTLVIVRFVWEVGIERGSVQFI